MGAHDGLLVALSITDCIRFLHRAQRRPAFPLRSSWMRRRVWILERRLDRAGSIWSMHFRHMLAFSMPGMRMSYGLGLTLLPLAWPRIHGRGLPQRFRLASGLPLRILAAGLLMGSWVSSPYALCRHVGDACNDDLPEPQQVLGEHLGHDRARCATAAI